MKTVGIITMHKVVNYGSVLQAWATQQVICKMGYKAEIIDYVYPNKYHKVNYKYDVNLEFIRFCLQLLKGFPWKRKTNKFKAFIKENLVLSKTYYKKEDIYNTPPEYDVYVAGSDQIWNLKYTNNDGTFFLDFAPCGRKKISYASSFAKKEISKEDSELIAKYLNTFDSLSVREKNGVDIVTACTGKVPDLCLDPTLLLTPKDYEPLCSQSKIRIKGKYILVYILKYAYNPYPYIADFIDKAYTKTGLKIVCIDFSARYSLKSPDVVYLHDSISPADFINLFAHASMVITTSFHGTAFALNFGIPVYSVINDKSASDDRMKSLLTCCGVPERAILMNTENVEVSLDNSDNDIIQSHLGQLREKSLNYLKRSI